MYIDSISIVYNGCLVVRTFNNTDYWISKYDTFDYNDMECNHCVVYITLQYSTVEYSTVQYNTIEQSVL